MLNFFIGLMIGGCTTACCLCLIQLNRIRNYEAIIEKLSEISDMKKDTDY